MERWIKDAFEIKVVISWFKNRKINVGYLGGTSVITRVPKCGRGRRVSIRVLPIECVVSGGSLSKKPINRLGWWKWKFALFQMLATEGSGQRTSVQRATHPTGNQWGKSFYRQKEGATCRNSTGNSDSHLQIDHRWSDQSHLDYFRYSSSLVPRSIWFISLRPILITVASRVPGTV